MPIRSIPRTAGKVLAWTLAVIVVLVAVLAVVIATFDWNRARPWVDDKVSQAIGRPFAINGDLRVSWHRPTSEHGWRAWVPWPRFSADRVSIGNPDWARAQQFATAEQISFTVEMLPLLAHTISVPSIDLVNPSIDLERLADGRDNWTFTLPKSKNPTRWTVRLANLGFAKGNIALADALKKIDLAIGIDTLGKPLPIGDVLKQQEAASRESAAHRVGQTGAHKLDRQGKAASAASGASIPSAASGASGSEAEEVAKPAPSPRDLYSLGFTAKGRYKTTAVEGSGKVGSVLALRDALRPFPLQADIKVGDTRLALVGTVTDPLHLSALDMRLWLQGESMSHLYPIIGVTLPDTPPYATDGRLAGHIRGDDTRLTYSGFTGRVGESDLGGTLTYTKREPRPLLTGNVVSHLLRFADLAPVVSADTNASKARRGDVAKQPADKALPVEPFKTDRWHAIDADVTFTGKRIVKNPDLPVTDLYTHVLLKDGALALAPLRFGVADGTLASNVYLDGSAVPLKARMSLSARHLKLKQLFPKQKSMQSALGEVNGDAAISAIGNSPAALASTLNGETKVVVTQGTVSRLLMEAAGLNVANVVYEKLWGHRDVNIRCGAADFVATNGVLESRTFAIDTDDALISIDGHIDLRDEVMDLGVHPHTKGLRVISLRSPLYVKGTFKHPDVGVSKSALVLRAGAAVGLGLLNPFAALLAVISPSRNQEAPCAALMASMREPPRAPPPGTKTRGQAPRAASAPNGAARQPEPEAQRGG